MARFLLDTNIFVYYACDHASLSRDVAAILEDGDNNFLMSAASVQELLVAYRTKNLLSKYWKDASNMIESIRDSYFIEVCPVDMEVMRTMSKLTINEAQNHYDPSDHVIISHAMTLKLPLISSDHKFPFYREQGLELIYNQK